MSLLSLLRALSKKSKSIDDFIKKGEDAVVEAGMVRKMDDSAKIANFIMERGLHRSYKLAEELVGSYYYQARMADEEILKVLGPGKPHLTTVGEEGIGSIFHFNKAGEKALEALKKGDIGEYLHLENMYINAMMKRIHQMTDSEFGKYMERVANHKKIGNRRLETYPVGANITNPFDHEYAWKRKLIFEGMPPDDKFRILTRQFEDIIGEEALGKLITAGSYPRPKGPPSEFYNQNTFQGLMDPGTKTVEGIVSLLKELDKTADWKNAADALLSQYGTKGVKQIVKETKDIIPKLEGVPSEKFWVNFARHHSKKDVDKMKTTIDNMLAESKHRQLRDKESRAMTKAGEREQTKMEKLDIETTKQDQAYKSLMDTRPSGGVTKATVDFKTAGQSPELLEYVGTYGMNEGNLGKLKYASLNAGGDEALMNVIKREVESLGPLFKTERTVVDKTIDGVVNKILKIKTGKAHGGRIGFLSAVASELYLRRESNGVCRFCRTL